MVGFVPLDFVLIICGWFNSIARFCLRDFLLLLVGILYFTDVC